MQKVPDVKFNFSGSNQLASNSQRAFAEAGSVFASLNKQRLADAALKQQQEQNAIKNQQIERQQIFRESADQRALDLENAKIQQKRNRRIQDNQVASGVLNELTENFSLNPQTLQAIQNDSRFKNLRTSKELYDENDDLIVENDTTRQDKILDDLNENFRQNPNLILDPQEVKRNIIKRSAELGLSDEETAKQVNRGLSSFQSLDPEISKALIEQNTSNQGQIADLLSKASGRKSNGSRNGSGSKANAKDARARYKFEKDEILSEYPAERGIFDKIIPGVIDDKNVSRENLQPIIDVFSQTGLEAASVHNAMKSLGIISGDKEWNINPEKIKTSADLQNKIVASASAFQGGSSNTESNTPSLSSALGLLKASQQDLQNQNNSILRRSTPRQTSVDERRKISLDFLAEQTGISLEDLEQPTKQQRQSVKASLINTNKNTSLKQKTKKQTVNNSVSSKDKFFEEDLENFQKTTEEGNSLNPDAKVFQKGTKENKLAFEKLRETKKKERLLETRQNNKQLDEAIATAKRLIEKNDLSPLKMEQLKKRLKQLELKRSK